VPIAVIDSEIDVTHPDLEGAVTKRFDAVGAPENSHAHGTGMAGAIAAHRRLLGTAPAMPGRNLPRSFPAPSSST
jgi:subtilisin family serine protease